MTSKPNPNADAIIYKGQKLTVVIRRDENGYNDGSIIAMPFDGHAYCIAKAPRFATDEEWKHNADLIVDLISNVTD
jgi:hypothetical protein